MTAGRVALADRTLLMVAAVSAFAFSAWYSHAAPCGIWHNQVFGSSVWSEADPGAWYVYSAYQLSSGGGTVYYGHPGTPLLLLLAALQDSYFAVAAPDGVGRARFIAQHLPQLFWLSKLMLTLFHLLSFWALFELSRALLRDRRAAVLATLGYATCFPVLYYLSRISPEPLAIGCLAAAFLSFWRYESLAAAGRVPRALGFLALSGVVAVTGAIAKIQLLGPLAPLLVVMLVTDLPRRMRGDALGWRIRLSALGVFGVTSSVTLAFYSQWIDWHRFFGNWFLLPTVRLGPRGVSIGDLLPGLSASNLLPTTETGYALVAAAGFVLLLRRHAELRPRAIGVALYGGFGLLLLAYRVSIAGTFLPFHYGFVALAIAAPFFGFALAAVERRMLPRGPGWISAALALAFVSLLHGVGLVAVVGSRRHDAEVFAPNRAGYELIARLGPGEVLLVESRSAPTQPIHGLGMSNRLGDLQGWSPRGVLGVGGPPPALRLAFESLFVPVEPGGAPAGLERVPVPLLRANLIRVQ